MAERKNYIDAVKGLSMMCIVAGHFGVSQVTSFVFTFHVPIFLIVSGLFFTPRDGIVKKRFIQLIKPYLTTAVLVHLIVLMKELIKMAVGRSTAFEPLSFLSRFALEVIYGSGSRTDFFSFELPAIGAVWFFWAIIWSTAIVFLTDKMIPEKYSFIKLLIITLVFIAGWLSAKYTWLPLSLQAGMSSSLFLYIGYIAKKHDILNKGIKPCWIVISILLWIVALYFSFVYDVQSVVRSYFPFIIINVSGSVAASYVIIAAVKRLDSIKKVSDFHTYHLVCFWGRNSSIILCCHLIELRTIDWTRFYTLGKAGIVMVFIIKIVVISITSFLILRSEKLKKFF